MADESFFKAEVYGLGITLAESLSGRAKLGLYSTRTKFTRFRLLEAAKKWDNSVLGTYGISRELAHLLTIMTQRQPDLRSDMSQVCAHPWVGNQ